jgi:hypothetical protein
MDAERFDRLVESLTRSGTRRGVVRTLSGAILGAAGLGALAGGDAAGKDTAKRKRRGNGKGKDRRGKNRLRAQAASCCSGDNCIPGVGKNLAKCCYEDQNLAGRNFKGANLGSANFSGAILTNANFTGANLDKTCFVDADLNGAKFNGANSGTAVYCRTTMPDGSRSIAGCSRGNRCCDTCNKAVGESCAAAGDVCCGGATCCDGTCVETGSDESHCGSCGNQCDSGLTCCGGTCVNLLTDLDNCTECGNVCIRPEDQQAGHVLVQCGEGVDDEGIAGYGCTYRCEPGFADCDGKLATGCERLVENVPDNCGGCGITCSSARPRCCGCRCLEPVPPGGPETCTLCQPITNARLIRRR